MEKIAAWAVHLFTASGLVAGFFGLLAAIESDYRMAMFWMLIALIIDGVDGTFARMARVQEILPGVSGKTIDYVIDFFTYAILPAYLFYVAIPLDGILQLVGLIAILMSSAVYYGIDEMVSEDGHHFIGFPVMWNMVLYIYIFLMPDAQPIIFFIATIAFAVLHFVPILVPYPSRGGRFFRLTLVVTVLFLGSALVNVYVYPEQSVAGQVVAWLSVAYFAGITAYNTLSQKAGT
ncbi:MAG: hypothetical protein AAGF87_00245 [Bacteroidota bacterium]